MYAGWQGEGGRGRAALHLHSTYPFLRDFSGTAMAQKAYFAGGKICVCKQNPLNRLMGAKKKSRLYRSLAMMHKNAHTFAHGTQTNTHTHTCIHSQARTDPRKDTDTVNLVKSREILQK